MKIKELIIENFRIFNGKKSFNFDNKELIVVSGKNGNGKSTIFDAIQWCLTGKIPRYEGSHERSKFDYLMNTVAFRDVKENVMAVEVCFEMEGSEVRVLRFQKKSKNGKLGSAKISVNGENFTQSEGEGKIREILIKEVAADEATLNLSAFFSATQLLSQDALNNFIRNDKPTERYNLMDTVLGVSKYGGDFSKYLDEVKKSILEKCDKLEEERQVPADRLIVLGVQLAEKETHLNSIGEVSEIDLICRMRELITQIRQLGIGVPDSRNRINQLDTQVYNEVVAIRKDAGEEKERHEKLGMNLKSAKKLLELTPEEYRGQRSALVKRQDRLASKMERRKKGTEIIRQSKNAFENLKVRKSRYQAALKAMTVLEKQLMIIEENEKSTFSHPSVIKIRSEYMGNDAFLRVYEKYLQDQADFNKLLMFNDLDASVKNLEKSLEDDRGRLVIYDSTLKEKQQLLDQVIQRLTEIDATTEGRKESMVHQLIHQVQDHIYQNAGYESCPVCGSKFESHEDLQYRVKRQIEKASQVLSELDLQKRDYTTKKNNIELDTREIRSEYIKLYEICESYRKRLEQTVFEREKVRMTVPVILLGMTTLEVQQKKTENEDFIKHHKIAYDLLKSIEENNKIREELEQKKDLHQQTFDKIKLESGRWAAYFDREEIAIEKKIEVFQNYFTKVAEEELRNKYVVNTITNQLDDLDQRWKQRELAINEICMDIPEFLGTVSDLERLQSNTEKRINELSQWDVEISAHLSKVQAFLSKDQITELRTQVQAVKNLVDVYDSEINKSNKLINDLEWLKKRHISVQSKLIGDYLLQHSEFIDQLFMQISPHAVYRHVQLIPKEKNLYVLMTKNSAKESDLRQLSENDLRKQFNANLTFSSAQSNILAVCIFLALNRSQKWTKLRLLGIDDPFQNLDDINVFSFIDVLSQIVIDQQKQVIISTHSDDFAHLMKVKMGLDPEKIGTIEFQSYSERGISVGGSCLK